VTASGHAESLLTRPWYRSYVLLILTLCYVANVMDRSQILAASIQAIKQEFGASDFQLGMLTGLPFALFYSVMGIPIAAWADRSSRRNVLALAVAVWSAMTAVFGMAVNFLMLFAARVGTAIGEAGGSPPSHSLISDYFRSSSVVRRSRSSRWPCRWARRSVPRSAVGATRISAGG
jgi:MFS family permease